MFPGTVLETFAHFVAINSYILGDLAVYFVEVSGIMMFNLFALGKGLSNSKVLVLYYKPSKSAYMSKGVKVPDIKIKE